MTTVIVAGVGLVVWITRQIIEALIQGRIRLIGWSHSQRYAEAHLDRVLAQHAKAPPGSEQHQFIARVSAARVQVEAHEAARRVGISGGGMYWISVAIAALFVAAVAPLAASHRSPVVWGLVGVVGAYGIASELLAIWAGDAKAERISVLAAANRYGHGDLVRIDPWSVLRTYDYWRAGQSRRRMIRNRISQDRRLTSPATRRERRWIGQQIFPRGIFVDRDIWGTQDHAEDTGAPSAPPQAHRMGWALGTTDP